MLEAASDRLAFVRAQEGVDGRIELLARCEGEIAAQAGGNQIVVDRVGLERGESGGSGRFMRTRCMAAMNSMRGRRDAQDARSAAGAVAAARRARDPQMRSPARCDEHAPSAC